MELEGRARHGPALARNDDLLEARCGGEREAEVEQRLIPGCGGVDTREHALELAGGGLERPERQARAAAPGLPVAAAEHERAVGDRLDPALAVVGRPAVERGAERSRCLHGLAGPGGGVRERVVGRRVEDPGVAAGSVEPLARAHGRVVARLGPARHQRREPAALEEGRQPARKLLADPVARKAAVAEREEGVRRDHVGRIAGDAAELLAGNRLEQAARPQLDVVDAVERKVERGESERALVDVGRDDLAGVAGEQERLDPVSGAEVERALDLRSDGQVGERRGRPVHARDAVRAVDVEPVGGNQEVVVRDDAHETVQQAVAFLGEPGLDQQVRLLVERHGIADEQERDQRREAVRLGREPAPVHLEVLVREDRLGGRVEPPRDPRCL